MKGLLAHQLFEKISPYLKIQECARRDGFRKPRVRIEWAQMPAELLQEAERALMPCVACGALVRLVRSRRTAQRGKTGSFYYAPCCPLDVKIGCSRGRQASDEYDRVERWYKENSNNQSRQLTLV